MAEGESPDGPTTGGPQSPGTDQGSDEGLIQTFLIADIRGYTSFSQEHGDEAAGRLAARFAEVTTQVIEAGGGTVLELRGDEALCIFSTTRRAIRSAIDLQARYLAETNTDPTLPLPVGIGIDTGEAVPVAGGFRGRALNLAARLCGSARAGEILATREALHMAGRMDGIHVEDRGLSSFKNIPEPVGVMRVTGEGEDPARWFAEHAPSPAPAKRSSTRRRLGITALATVLVAVVAVIAILHVSRSSEGQGRQRGTAPEPLLLHLDDKGHRIGEISGVASVGSITRIAVGEGAVWVSTYAGLFRIDPSLDRPIASIAATGDVTTGFHSVWVAGGVSSLSAGQLGEFDPATTQSVLRIGHAVESAVAVGAGGVWTFADGGLARFDPRTGRWNGRVAIDGTATDIAVSGGEVWFVDFFAGSLTAVDGRTLKVIGTVPIPGSPDIVDVGHGFVWIVERLSGIVTVVDPETMRLVKQIPVAIPATGLALGRDTIWVTAGNELFSINPSTFEATSIDLGVAALAVAVDPSDDTLWVCVDAIPVAAPGGSGGLPLVS